MVAVRLLGALGLLGVVAGLLARLAPAGWPRSAQAVPGWLTAGPVEARVASLAVVAAYACLAWLALVLLCVACGAFPRGALRDAAERVLGAAVVGAAAGALAAGPAVAADGPFDRPAGPADPPLLTAPVATRLAPAPARIPPRPPAPGAVVVAPGDTLWSIAARRLGPGASPALVAATWPRWYAANRPRIGPDPGLIRPGQRLAPPVDAAPAEGTS